MDHQIYSDLENPILILFWDPLEFTLAITMLGFGIAMDIWLGGLLLSIGVLYGAKYLKRGAKRGAAQHFLWSMGLALDSRLLKRFGVPWVTEVVN